MRAALAELGVDLDRLRADRAGRGAGQWRPRPARRLLHGQHGDAVGRRPTATASATTTACSARCIKDGWQHEYPGELAGVRQPVGVRAARGRVLRSASAAPSRRSTAAGRHRARTSGIRPRRSMAVAYDTPVVGWRGTPRQHAAAVVGARDRPAAARRLQPRRPCRRARQRARRPNAISQVLYPSDATPAGQELRLRQEYFFTSASLQDIVRRHLQAARRHRARCPTRSPSSSTTRIRRSPSPS